MKWLAMMVLALGLGLTACSKEETPPPASDPDASDATMSDEEAAALLASMKTISAEVGCADCIYNVDGVKGCDKIATKVNGQTLLVSGVDFNFHDAGLCSKAKQASLTGVVKDGEFVASNLTLE